MIPFGTAKEKCIGHFLWSREVMAKVPDYERNHEEFVVCIMLQWRVNPLPMTNVTMDTETLLAQ